MTIRNEDVKEITVTIPEGHSHLRTTITLTDGTEFTFQEATIANLLRAFITVKTHPVMTGVTLTGRSLKDRKDGYAQWQLVE